jgi:uncharacterized protein
MIRVRVAGVALDAAQQHVILLKPMDEITEEGRMLPIWIGAQEATSILVAVEGAIVPRPLAHDLMRSMIEALDAVITGVAITRIEDGTFFAEVTLASAQGNRVIDARPSDAVALASRVDAPIWVAEEVMDEAALPDTMIESADEADEEERVDEFKRFLEDVDPDDFRG